MKHARKLASLLLALVMVLSLATTAFAAQEGTLTGGSITINNAVPGQVYKAYQILYLESYNKDTGAYSYKANSAWETWLRTQTTYVSFDAQGYVSWVDKYLDCSESHDHIDTCYKTYAENEQTARVAAFAKLAQAEATKESSTINFDATATAPTAAEGATYSTVEFTNLNLGYYLVDTTLGTLCSLDTTNPNVVMQEKNEVPTNVKTVEEGSTYKPSSDAAIGDTVNFKSTITAQKGAENYVFHDKMSTGLTYNNDAKVYTDETMTQELAAANYTVTSNPSDSDTFDITFTQNYLNTITAETMLYVKYSATLNEHAVIAGDGNSNTSKLSYGDSSNTQSTPGSSTVTYTWGFDVLKYGNMNESNVLKEAKFVLLNRDKTKVATILSGKLTGWVNVPTATEGQEITWPDNTVQTTGNDGKIRIEGLDAGSYHLRETKAPAGYNKLNEDVLVTINPTSAADGKTMTLTAVTAKVNNQSGTELPSTGGMGTTIFYVLGSILAVGAIVLLVTKKRMSAAD